MKPLNRLLVAAAAALTLTLTPSVLAAGETFLTPHARDLQVRVAPNNNSVNDPDLTAQRPAGNAKAWTLALSMRTVAGTGSGIDLANAQRPTMSAKDPRFGAALRSNAVREFEIAPLK